MSLFVKSHALAHTVPVGAAVLGAAEFTGKFAQPVIDWIWSKLPGKWGKWFDQKMGTPELGAAIEKVRQAKKDLDSVDPSWAENEADTQDWEMQNFLRQTSKF